MNSTELWNRLAAEEIVSGDVPPPGVPGTPWPVRTMLGISGWIGASFLCGFLFAVVAGNATGGLAKIVVGLVSCAIAYGFFVARGENAFLKQFGLAVGLTGQLWLTVGVSQLFGPGAGATKALILTLVECALALALPNYLHRAITAAAAGVSLLIGATLLGYPAIATALMAVCVACVWLDPVRLARRPQLWPTIGYGCALALVNMEAFLLAPNLLNSLFPSRAILVAAWLGPVALGAILLFVAWRLCVEAGLRWPIVAIGVIALGGLWAPGLSASTLVLIIGFANRDRILTGLGILGSVSYLSHYYYQMNVSLWSKSFVLAGTGVALLLARFALDRYLNTKEVEHA